MAKSIGTDKSYKLLFSCSKKTAWNNKPLPWGEKLQETTQNYDKSSPRAVQSLQELEKRTKSSEIKSSEN